LPRHDVNAWVEIEREKRSLYESQKQRFLAVSAREKLEVKAVDRPISESIEMLSQIQKDVLRTRQEMEYFQRPATRISLVSLLFVYAQMNRDVEYVQGMSEIAAVILYVMSSLGPDFAEHDAFWCFTQLMNDIKPGFMSEMDHCNGGIYSVVNSFEQLLRRYDAELAKHLQRCGSPHTVLIFRWTTLLFAQDADMENILRLWDAFMADPKRYQLVVHSCLAAALDCRDELLSSEDDFEVAEAMRKAPRKDFELLLRRSWAICALERRTQTPMFPVKTAAEIVDQLSEWAQGAAFKANELRAEFARSLQDNVAPVVRERASLASSAAREVTKDKAQAVQTWLQDTAPGRREALEKAQTRISSMWQTTSAVTQKAAKTFVETM